MPKKLTDCVSDVMAQGKPKDSAWPICINSTGEKPHTETIEEVITRQIVETRLERGGGCGCQKKK